MQKWEYLHMYFSPDINNSGAMQKEWDAVGLAGWELVAVTLIANQPIRYMAFFKRPF